MRSSAWRAVDGSLPQAEKMGVVILVVEYSECEFSGVYFLRGDRRTSIVVAAVAAGPPAHRAIHHGARSSRLSSVPPSLCPSAVPLSLSRSLSLRPFVPLSLSFRPFRSLPSPIPPSSSLYLPPSLPPSLPLWWEGEREVLTFPNGIIVQGNQLGCRGPRALERLAGSRWLPAPS